MAALREKQSLFVHLTALFIFEAERCGYELTDGDSYRDPRVHGKVGEKMGYGHPRSNHKQRLAKDWNLFKDGKLIRTIKGYEPLGTFWESLHPLARWGGRWGDAPHFSLEHEGQK